MDNQRRQQLVEQYEEIALSLLMDDYANEEGAWLMKEFEEAQKNGEVPEIPTELDDKCRKLIDRTFAKQERKVRLTRIGKSIAKVAVIALVALGLLTTTVMSVDALRIPVLNFVLQLDNEYSSIFADGGIGDQTQINTLSETFDAIIPNTYQLIMHENNEDGSTVICYKNESDNLILLDIYPYGGIYNIDTEDSAVSKISVYKYDAYFLDKNGYRVMWLNNDSNRVFDLYADDIELESFLELANALASQDQ